MSELWPNKTHALDAAMNSCIILLLTGRAPVMCVVSCERMQVPGTNAQRLKLAGIALFALSFIPRWAAFLHTPRLALGSFEDAFKNGVWNHAPVGLALALGWLDNFTVFFRLLRWAAGFAIVAPWLVYFSLMFLNYHPGVEEARPNFSVATYWPFYPWALGVGLIHGSRLLEPATRNIPLTAWTGF